MDARAAKLALARQKLKDHQVKKSGQKEDKPEPDSHNQQVHQLSEITEKCPATFYNENGNTQEHEQGEIQPPVPECNVLVEESKMSGSDLTITEILISSKRNLEIQVNELQSKLSGLEYNLSVALELDKVSKQTIYNLENTLKELNERNQMLAAEISSRNTTIEELNKWKLSLSQENNNLCEQLDFTKSILVEKESENASLRTQLHSCQQQLESLQLQVEQLTNGYPTNLNQDVKILTEQNEILIQQVSSLEQQIKQFQKEKEQTNINYEQYVKDLSEQSKSLHLKNEQLKQEILNQTSRENSLIEQIGDMEIRLQNYRQKSYEQPPPVQIPESNENCELQKNYEDCLEKIKHLTILNDQLKQQNFEKNVKIQELNDAAANNYKTDNISIVKLNADITSDKVALQRATEQNKKLKKDLKDLEEDFVKMTKDKLDLTEKLAAEKYLNKELTIKLAEINEEAKDTKTKLMAKDEEMIRLQANYRNVEKKIEFLSDLSHESVDKIHYDHHEHHDHHSNQSEHDPHGLEDHHGHHDHHDHHGHRDIDEKQHSSTENSHVCEHDSLLENSDENKRLNLAKEDAMLKLQARFYKIMEEVADLSDEKHRLEHIILQLQNETDTICEYVALYQHQRCLLKKRDEERSAQIKLFQMECERLKRQIEELGGILKRFAEDKELTTYFQLESRRNDKEKIMNLINELKNNSLIDPKRNNLELNNFYPCNCCSGKLIDL